MNGVQQYWDDSFPILVASDDIWVAWEDDLWNNTQGNFLLERKGFNHYGQSGLPRSAEAAPIWEKISYANRLTKPYFRSQGVSLLDMALFAFDYGFFIGCSKSETWEGFGDQCLPFGFWTMWRRFTSVLWIWQSVGEYQPDDVWLCVFDYLFEKELKVGDFKVELSLDF